MIPRSLSSFPPAGRTFRPVISFFLFLLLSGVLAGCSLFEEETFNATVSGRIIDEVGAPVPSALVTATFASTTEREPMTTVPDDDGAYTFSFTLDEGEQVALSIRAELKETVIGERELTLSDRTRDRTDVNFVLLQKNDDPNTPDQPSTESGTLSRIVVAKQSGTVIRVRESGGPESVSITFAAIDSIGRRLASDRAVEMQFALGKNPGAGLAVNPTSIETNALGEATAIVTSGTQSGVVQLVAEATAADGSVVRSDPVRITIHGGMPAQERFTFGPTIRNIPGLVRFNETTDLEVILGDKYGNPVVPGTAVYFTATHGVVGGSTETDAEGLGSVVLRSGNPLPTQNGGIVIATAETAGENEERVFAQTPVIFSGPTTIQLQPASADFGSYTLKVSDPLGNPLVDGTSIKVTVEGAGTLVSGFTETILDDTGVRVDDPGDGLLESSDVTVVTGLGITEFPFSVSEDPESTVAPDVTAINVSVTSPNGDLDVSVFPKSIAKSSDGGAVQVKQDASVERLGSGAVQVTLREQGV